MIACARMIRANDLDGLWIVMVFVSLVSLGLLWYSHDTIVTHVVL